MRSWLAIYWMMLACLVQPQPPELVAKENQAQLVTVKKIWDAAPHNAFTDLIRFKDRWFCVFREGKTHESLDGAIRLISSTDGSRWDSAALLQSPKSDLRDPKLTLTPDGKLLLSAAENLHDRSKNSYQSLVWLSKDGRVWSERYEVGDRDNWLWRITWHKQRAYGIGYGCGTDQYVRLYSSKDGVKFDTLVPRLFDKGFPNESSMVFVEDRAYCLLRRDGKENSGLFGIAKAPFTSWKWKDLRIPIGGPHMIRLADGRFIAAVRLYDGKIRTSLCWIDPEAGKLTEFHTLPSGGDTSYAGLVYHEDLLWVSYYSSHEGKTSIYLARVRLPKLAKRVGT